MIPTIPVPDQTTHQFHPMMPPWQSQLPEQRKIYKQILAVMAEVGSIGKTQDNKKQGYKFRGIDDVYNALNPLLAKHGIFTVPMVLEEKSHERQTSSGGVLFYRILKMKYTFYADDGSFVEAIVIGEGMDSGDKASNKAMAVAHKYALLQVFCIPTEDHKDPEHDDHEVAADPEHYTGTNEQKVVLMKTLVNNGIKNPEDQKRFHELLLKEKVKMVDLAEFINFGGLYK